MSLKKMKWVIRLVHFLLFFLVLGCLFITDSKVINKNGDVFIIDDNNKYCKASITLEGKISFFTDFAIMVRNGIFADDSAGEFNGILDIQWEDNHLVSCINKKIYYDCYNKTAFIYLKNDAIINEKEEVIIFIEYKFDYSKDIDNPSRINIYKKNTHEILYSVSFLTEEQLKDNNSVINSVYSIGNGYRYNLVSMLKECTVLVCIIFSYFAVMQMLLRFCYKQEVLTIKNLIKEKEMYYANLIEREESTRKFRHDYNAFLLYIRKLVLEENSTELLNYIDKISENMNQQINRVYRSGNDIIDCYMNFHLSKLPTNINIEILGKIDKEIPFDDVELSIVIDNVFKNICDLLKESKEKGYIIIDLSCGKQFISMKFKNNIPKDVFRKKNRVYSDGCGISNIKSVLKKYGGHMDIFDNREEYQTNIIIDTMCENEDKDENCSM